VTKLYEADFYTWAMTQADAARRRSANELDWENVAEELESLGKSEARELYSRYVILITHLLKWMYQPARRSKGWLATIGEQRTTLARHMRQNPGLQPKEAEEFADAYAAARFRAMKETKLDLDAFPDSPPFTIEQAKDATWLPEEPEGP
jgi:hypothetical protein